MSKSLNLFLPAFGGTALVLGVAYGAMSRDYAADRIDTLEARVAQVTAHADTAAQRAQAEATRAAQLQAEIAEIGTLTADLTAPAPRGLGPHGLGRPALPEEIAAWDLDVLPDGRGLPVGSGDAMTGEEVFADACAACHGDFAEGVDNWPVLAGGFDTLGNKDPVKTVGSYWPHLSTVWDYVNRSMPFGAAQTLAPDDVYAIVAYILYSNDLVDEDFVLSNENFAEFEMYNKDGFIIDDRAETEYPLWRGEPCMQDCKPGVEITMHASVLNVTPDVETDAAAEPAPVVVAAAPAPDQAAAAAPAPASAPAPDPALVAAGEKVFRKCKSCHQVGEGAANRTGPHLNGVFGRTFGATEGFRYSPAFQAAADDGRVWDDAAMAEFLARPKSYIEGTRMSFAGLRSDDDIAAVIAYLHSFGE